jgi:hypothetical protein
MNVFRIVIECDVEDDFDLVFGALNGIEHFSNSVRFAIELVEKIDPKESNNGNETESSNDPSRQSGAR